jgi:hypothetical protein
MDADGKWNAGLVRIEGDPPRVWANEVDLPWFGAGAQDPNFKGCGLLSVNGTLYHFLRYQKDVPGMTHWREREQIGSVLVWSQDHGRTWHGARYANHEDQIEFFFSEPDRAFSMPFFLQAGKDYTAWKDPYVYLYSPGEGRRVGNDTLHLARVPKNRIPERDAYEFFAGLDSDGQPAWSKDVRARAAVLSFPGNLAIGDALYLPTTERILLVTAGADFTGPSSLTVLDAPAPWGPWTVIGRIPAWGTGRGGDFRYEPRLPAKWVSPDEQSLYLVFSDRKDSDKLNYQRLILERVN